MSAHLEEEVHAQFSLMLTIVNHGVSAAGMAMRLMPEAAATGMAMRLMPEAAAATGMAMRLMPEAAATGVAAQLGIISTVEPPQEPPLCGSEVQRTGSGMRSLVCNVQGVAWCGARCDFFG